MYKLNLAPIQADYTVTDGVEVVRVDLAGGMGRYRRDILKASKTVNVTWWTTTAEYDYLRAFYRVVVAEGARRFLIDLIIDSPELVEHEAMIIPGTMQLAGVMAGIYHVTAQLEVMPVDHDYNDDSDYIGVVSEWGLNGWEAALLDIHDSVVLVRKVLA